MSILWNIFLLICFLLGRSESRKSLRDYIVSRNHSNVFGTNDYFVYDSLKTPLLCRLQTFSNGFNTFSNLNLYPSEESIASIRNVWSPYLYQSYFNVLDDQLNHWMKGEIFELSHPQRFRFLIKYGGKYYLMENVMTSSITEIRDLKKPNDILTRFTQTSFHPFFQSSKYYIQIYTDHLPDPIYILALYALDSTTRQRRITFIP